MSKINSLGVATTGTQYFDGVNTYTGVTGTTGQALIATTSAAPTFGTLGPSGGGTGTSTAFTAGSVVFSGNFGVYTQDNSNFFWDNSNKLLGIGTNTPSSGTAAKVRIDNTGSNTSRTALNITGTQTASVGIPTGIWVDTTFSPTVGGQVIAINSDPVFNSAAATTLAGICYYASPAFASNAGTLTVYGYFYDGGGPLVGTIDFQWGGYFSNPTAGNVKVALYAANMAIGSYTTNQPPSNGLIVSGKVGIGTSSPNASDYITISPSFTASGGAAYVERFTGITLTAAATNDEFNMHRLGAATLATTTGSFTGLTFYGSRFFGPSKTGNGTFSNAYGYYAGAIASIATNQYGGYFQTPTGGTVNHAIYSDNLSVGYATNNPPSSGAIVSGAVGIGTSGPLSKLDVSGGVAIGTYAGVSAAPSNGMIVSGQTLFKESSAFVNASVEIGGADRVSFGIGGTKTSTDGSVQTSAYLGATYQPSSTTAIVSTIVSYPQFNPPTGVTITTAYNFLLQSGGQAGLGSVTTGVGLYVENPGFGTTKYAAILNGTTTINTSVIDGTSKLTVSGGLSVSAARTDGYGLISINETSNAGIQFFQTSNSSSINGAVIQLIHTRGTYASPSATQSGDVLGVIDFGGYTNTIYGPGAVIIGSASQTWTSTAAGSQLDFYVTNNSSTSNSLAFSLSSQGSAVCGGNNGAALATNATDGFLYIPSCNGTPTGTPTAYTGRNAMVYDTSANKLWIYNGSWKGVVVT